MEVFRVNPLWKPIRGKEYDPAFLVIKKKIYRVTKWHDAIKLLMYSFWEKNTAEDATGDCFAGLFVASLQEETKDWVKFSPTQYIKIYSSGYENYELLLRIRKCLGDYLLVVVQREKSEQVSGAEEKIRNRISELKEERGFKSGSARHLLARINGQILTKKEQFFLRTEKVFDRTTLIGDIDLTEDEDRYLHQFMTDTLPDVIYGSWPIPHDKVFALGMVRVAMKHYAQKTFWPYVQEEYGIALNASAQAQVNKAFKEILQRYGKKYDEGASGFVQNICMHCFVCDRCADQLFDYLFEFWRVDLSRSLENSICEDGSDLFDVLIEEIERNAENGVQDIMIHTTMALQQNPAGCKIRLRRLLKMIDNSYWSETDYSRSSNRLTRLFQEWKQDRNGLFARDLKKNLEQGSGRKGEKLLSAPVICMDRQAGSFSIQLPRQILRNCSEAERPVWRIKTDGAMQQYLEPSLLRGKSSLFTEECAVFLEEKELFSRIELTLASDERQYVRRVIPSADVRFFNSRQRCVEVISDSISRDAICAMVKKGKTLSVLGREFDERIEYNTYNLIPMTIEEGDVILLPDDHAVAVGRPFQEGLFGISSEKGVFAEMNGEQYAVMTRAGSIFFRTSRRKCQGTSLRVEKFGKESFWGKVSGGNLKEFLLEDKQKDVYGYFLDLKNYLRTDGLYRVTLDIPGNDPRSFRICYVKDFRYEYVGAPYFFKETGEIVLSAGSHMVTSPDWEKTGETVKLVFGIDENGRSLENNTFVRDRKLHLNASIDRNRFVFIYDMPVFYWKYRKTDPWVSGKPEDVPRQQIPDRIYVAGDLDLGSLDIQVLNGSDLEDDRIPVEHDAKEELYYYSGRNIREILNRDYVYRYLGYRVNGKPEIFLNVICKSIVRSSSLTGNFDKGIIYGNFEIMGSGEYTVSVRYGEEVIEEAVPVVDGRFELSCEVREGTYNVTLYEMEEEDEFGFEPISYVLETYELKLTDVRHLDGKRLELCSLDNINPMYGDLTPQKGYFFRGLRHLNYADEVRNSYDIISWRYDFKNDEETVSGFQYYLGRFGFTLRSGSVVDLGKTLIIFDDAQNVRSVLVNIIRRDNIGELLIYDTVNQKLVTDEGRLTKYEHKRAKSVDDDIYMIMVDIV